MPDVAAHLSATRRAILLSAATAFLAPGRAKAAPPSADAIRQAVGAPAAGVAWVKAGRTSLSVAGRRAHGHDAPVREDDRWHLGSLTKSMTALLAARLAERGVLSMNDRMGERLGDLAGLYSNIKLAALLRHRGGLAANPPISALVEMKANPVEDLVEARRRYLAIAFQETGGPEGRFLYSNIGYVAAAAMIEAAASKPWEALIHGEVFAPLGLVSAGFGPPGAAMGAPDQPWGHHRAGDFFAHPPTAQADNPVEMNPAGRVHMSLADFLAYTRAHAARAPILDGENWDMLHRPATDSDARYAMGWIAPRDDVRIHSGSNTIWFATGGFNVVGDAITIVTNIAQGADLPGPVERPALEFLTGV